MKADAKRGCQCCGSSRRAELEREGRAAAADPDADARLWAVAGRYAVSLGSLRRHLERHETVVAAVVTTANVNVLRSLIVDGAVDPRDIALAMLDAVSTNPEVVALVIAHVAAPRSAPSESMTRPSLARAPALNMAHVDVKRRA